MYPRLSLSLSAQNADRRRRTALEVLGLSTSSLTVSNKAEGCLGKSLEKEKRNESVKIVYWAEEGQRHRDTGRRTSMVMLWEKNNS
jgi:hypothetical protein